MLEKFQNHINSHFPFLKGSKLLLAVSGGIDSMVLLHLCYHSGLDVTVAHCNFQLRGDENLADFKLVMGYCLTNNLEFRSTKFETEQFARENKKSIQVAARELRYQWFDELMEQEGFDYLLTAHHLEDSLETFLIHLTRGSGLTGLLGIPELNGKIVRPLLIFDRNAIEAFAQENVIEWNEDSSNASDKYFRNKLRHHVVPVLKELNPSLLASFQNTIESLEQAQSLVDDASRIVYRKVVADGHLQKKINLPELLQLPNYKAYLYQWLEPFGFTDWPTVYDLVQAQSGKEVFSATHALLKDRNALIVYPLPKEKKETEVYFIEKGQNEVKVPLKLTFCKVNDIGNQSRNTIFVDENKLQFPLTIRRWQQGDIFAPLGMTGTKKLSKFFKDEKFSLLDKADAWLLCSNDQIVWVIGKRQDDRFKVTENTTNALKINYND